MVYCSDGDILIRDMLPEDAREIVEGELAQGWHATLDKYRMRLADRDAGRSVALTAEYRGAVAGYGSVYPSGLDGPFAGRLPEIVDLGVLEKYRRRGVGSRLMEVAEEIAAGYADTVYLGVGLHAGYGGAQRMYVRRGYVPDGSGAWYGSAVCPPYGDCRNDDDLVIYLTKALRKQDAGGGSALRRVRNNE